MTRYEIALGKEPPEPKWEKEFLAQPVSAEELPKKSIRRLVIGGRRSGKTTYILEQIHAALENNHQHEIWYVNINRKQSNFTGGTFSINYPLIDRRIVGHIFNHGWNTFATDRRGIPINYCFFEETDYFRRASDAGHAGYFLDTLNEIDLMLPRTHVIASCNLENVNLGLDSMDLTHLPVGIIGTYINLWEVYYTGWGTIFERR